MFRGTRLSPTSFLLPPALTSLLKRWPFLRCCKKLTFLLPQVFRAAGVVGPAGRSSSSTAGGQVTSCVSSEKGE